MSKLPFWAIGPFERPKNVNPVVRPSGEDSFLCPVSSKEVRWRAQDTFNPAAVVKDGKVIVLFRAEDELAKSLGHRTSRLGYASSTDGLHFQAESAPVFYPANDAQKEMEWPGGCEDPRLVVSEDGLYVLLYTQWNRKVARLGVATSRDLRTWLKHGHAFGKAFDGRFTNMWAKSASIVTAVIDGKLKAVKVNGKYLMYWGESWVNLATSDDLINWTPTVDAKGDLYHSAFPRKGHFDSVLTECGPPAVLTDYGIVLLYNGKNASGQDGDVRYPAGTYCGGQFLFDKDNPVRLIESLPDPFFYPQEPFEKSGQYKDGTVFMEGLVWFKDKWFLYYGCADSFVAVATSS